MNIFLGMLLGYQIVPVLMTGGKMFHVNFHFPSTNISLILNDCSLSDDEINSVVHTLVKIL